MRITAKVAQQMLEVLNDLWEEVRAQKPMPYPYAEWERKRQLVKERLRKLPTYVEQAASMLHVEKAAGRPKNGTLTQRTMLFLFARLMNKSNRDVEELLELFQPLFGIEVSYKTIERLYSDREVQSVVHNLFVLLLKDENVSGHVAGDGSGYTLTITKHYRNDPKKHSKDYRYAFRIMDLEEGLYIGVGYSAKSEMEAFKQAHAMVKEMGLPITSGRFDRYFSSRKVLELFGAETSIYVIPKTNMKKIGLRWSAVLRCIMNSPFAYLKEYLKRNLSEAGYSSDKRRFGWTIRQRREDRQDAALFSIALLHNIFFVRVKPG